ncbi:hypothetical protein F5Y15DRAFT_312660 [Xylariaceae sp. FL0016]|nr:hypothetical protein F5Y15DRAFT_312660 [Xylariaceae sp. FL0016]
MSGTTATTYPPGYLEENRGDSVIAAATVILIFTTVLFGLRLYARSLTNAKRGWDDHLLIPAYVFLLGLLSCLYADVDQAGLGQHGAAVMAEDPKKINKFLMLLYILDWFYVPSNMLSRVSVVVLYLRIFTDKWARAACWFVMAFLIANCLATIIAAQLECTPLAYTWDKSLPGGGTCFNQMLWYQLTNFPNIIGDVMIMLLPIRTVWGLKASLARKAGIATVCLTGSIGLIASCVRASIFYTQKTVIETDPTFAVDSFAWTAIECGMYFSAACLIGMRPLFSRLPHFIKVRVLNASDNVGGTYAPDTAQHKRSKKRDASKYASVYSEKSQNHGEAPLLHAPPAAYMHPETFSNYSNGSNGNGIRVETNIQVTRDFDRYYP